MNDLRQRLAEALEDVAETQDTWAPTLTPERGTETAVAVFAAWLRHRAWQQHDQRDMFLCERLADELVPPTPHGCDDACVEAAEHGMHPPIDPKGDDRG